jgi:hypothetical protein
MIAVKAVPFSVDVVGEVSGEQYKGVFKALPVLTHNQQLERDRIRREFLGQMSDAASARAMNQAALLAEIAIRLTEFPTWWADSKGGMELYDDAPVAEIYAGCMKAEQEFKAAVVAKGEAARGELKKLEPKAE